MIERAMLVEAKYTLTQFRAVCITGARQSCKTTLSKVLFKGKPYLRFENPAQHENADAGIAALIFMTQACFVIYYTLQASLP